MITNAKKMISDGYVYVYGYKGAKVTVAVVNSLAKQYPSVFTSAIKSLALKKVGKYGIDCSGFVCKVAGISAMGSSQIKSSAPESWSVSNLANVKNGMFIWKSGHIGLIEVDSSGNKWILEAQSTATDLKRTAFASRYKHFTHYGKIKGVTYTSTNTHSTATSSTGTITMTVNAPSGLNVRKTYSTTSEKLGTLPNGTKVEVQKLGKIWARITYNGRTGYVYKQYLK